MKGGLGGWGLGRGVKRGSEELGGGGGVEGVMGGGGLGLG